MKRGRLFRKRWAVILEALGVYSGRAWRFGWGCVEVWVGMWGGFGGNAGRDGFGAVFLGGDDVHFLYKYAAKVFFMLILGQKCEFWVLVRIPENT